MNRPRLTEGLHRLIKGLKADDENRVLVIGDIHEPFCLQGYLEFCVEVSKKFNTNKVVFIGDVIDNHYSSYHETDADGMSGGQELDLSIKKIANWRDAFPVADVIIGNHDRLIMRKAQTSAIPSKWIKSYKEVLEVPNWNFVERVVIDGVQYIHGEGGTRSEERRVGKECRSRWSPYH